MCECFAQMYHQHAMRVDQKRARDSLELGLQVAGTLCVSDWTIPVSPAEAASTLSSTVVL